MKQVLVLLLAVGSACSSGEPSATSPASTASAAASASPPDVAAVDSSPAAASGSATGMTTGSPEACAEIKSRFEKTLAGGTGKCASDAECGCYPGSLAEGHLCGGVSDVGTTDKLRELFREFRVAHCHATACKAAKCQATCKQGTCAGG